MKQAPIEINDGNHRAKQAPEHKFEDYYPHDSYRDEKYYDDGYYNGHPNHGQGFNHGGFNAPSYHQNGYYQPGVSQTDAVNRYYYGDTQPAPREYYSTEPDPGYNDGPYPSMSTLSNGPIYNVDYPAGNAAGPSFSQDPSYAPGARDVYPSSANYAYSSDIPHPDDVHYILAPGPRASRYYRRMNRAE